MHYRSFLILLFAIMSLSSCVEECDFGNLDNVIVGRWNVFNGPDFLGEVSFRNNGSIVDPDHVFFGGFINGISFEDKQFAVFENQFIVITVFSDSGLSFFEQELNTRFFDCDFIESDMDLNIPISLERI